MSKHFIEYHKVTKVNKEFEEQFAKMNEMYQT